MAVEIEVTRENPAPPILALVNPNRKTKKGKKHMARETQAEKIARLESELDEATSRIEELEDERQGALSALSSAYGVEVLDDEDLDDEDFDEGNGEED
jgi:hypothetical protein